MPVILFNNLDALRLALTSGVVAPPLASAGALAGVDAKGQLWLQPKAVLPRATIAALTRLGATVQGTSGTDLTVNVGSWLELLPLIPIPLHADSRPSPVLFDVADARELPAVLAEARRLGAGAISTTLVTSETSSESHSTTLPSRAFALVESPPFHSLLRAADKTATGPRIYFEQAPHVWVEVGWRHPLAEMIAPREGHLLLLRAPRESELLPKLSLQSGPTQFELPTLVQATQPRECPAISVALRLIDDRSLQAPDLWVLRDRPMEQLRQLVEQSDDRLLTKLSIAHAEIKNRLVVVLRARPGREGSPILVLDGLACRPHARLPNLYVPVGKRLSPPLRRDVVRQLLASDPDSVVWIVPGQNSEFAVHTLVSAAFRPLEEMVAYVQDVAPQSLVVPSSTSLFEMTPFAAREIRASAPPPKQRTTTGMAALPTAPPAPEQPGLIQRIVRWFAPRTGDEPQPQRQESLAPIHAAESATPDLWDERRRLLEERFLASINAREEPDRSALWPELAELYLALDRPSDSAVCWVNALWEVDDAPAGWRRGWMRAEARTARGEGSDSDLQRWLSSPPSHATVRAMAAYVAWAAALDSPPSSLVESLQIVQRILSEHESWLPVRAAWLAHEGLCRIAGGDAVGLARARDRLLQRLHDSGLSADLDVPPALRFAGAGERVESVRRWLVRAREPIHRWLGTRASESETAAGSELQLASRDPRLQAFGLGTATGPTRAYADLILAWGLARTGERGASQELLAQARGVLAREDAAHAILLDAFAFRIGQALEGRSTGPLPVEILSRLTDLEQLERTDPAARERMLLFKAERLRQYSRILEPAEHIRAFSEGWLQPHAAVVDDLDSAGLRAIGDREELARRLLTLVASAGRDSTRLPIVLATALDLAPRLGESVAGDILERLLGVLDSWTFAGPAERVEAEVTALERGLFLAAHLDRPEAVQQLLSSLGRLLESRRGDEPGENRPIEDSLISAIGQSLRGLRRLGLRAEADRLLTRLGEWIAPGQDFAAERRRRPQLWPKTLRRLLALAGGWFYVGRDGPAIEVLDEARRLLFAAEPSIDERRAQTELACAYAAALGQAPVQIALNGVEELFQQLSGVSDTLITNTHYSLAKLRLVEATILAVVTDDFALGPAVRRWLDDDEYRVRRRIHRDTRRLIGAGD